MLHTNVGDTPSAIGVQGLLLPQITSIFFFIYNQYHVVFCDCRKRIGFVSSQFHLLNNAPNCATPSNRYHYVSHTLTKP